MLISLNECNQTLFEEFTGLESGRGYEISNSVNFRGEVSFEVSKNEDVDDLMSLRSASPAQPEGELLRFNLLSDLLYLRHLIRIYQMLLTCYGLLINHDVRTCSGRLFLVACQMCH